MHRVTVYNYVLDSLDNILKNGIEYYNGKDKELYNKLLMISEFIKDNSNIPEEKVIKKEIKECKIPNPVQILVNDYMNKVCTINIEAINIDKKKEEKKGNIIISKEEIVNNIEEKVDNSIDISVNNEYNTINEKKEQNVPSRKSVLLDLFKW